MAACELRNFNFHYPRDRFAGGLAWLNQARGKSSHPIAAS